MLQRPGWIALAWLFLAALGIAQQTRGELRISAHDAAGGGLAATAALVSGANDYNHSFTLNPAAPLIVSDLPFGEYTLTVRQTGFAPFTQLVDINSELPVVIDAALRTATVTTEVQVSAAATLINPQQASTAVEVGTRTVQEHLPVQPGRALSDLVDEQPGWLQEANGVLHPRGAEYDVQYVQNGQPVTENQSVGFAPPPDAAKIESLRVLTAGYPAEYGRKLGGIVEVTTNHNYPQGLHGEIDGGGGSFDSASGSAEATYSTGKNAFSFAANGLHSNRYMDPPVLANYTNTANASGVSGSIQRDFSSRTRVRLSLSQARVSNEVPDELVQAQAGQREDIHDGSTGIGLYLRHVISNTALFTAAASLDSATAQLNSNPQSTPIIISQNRGYHQGYVRADLAGEWGRHDWKIGTDSIFNPVYEQLQYQITDPTQFDPGTRPQFAFSARQWDIEPAAYVQDQWHLGAWNISYGIRFDHYDFVVNQSAWSPRLSVSRYIANLSLLVHASYDHAFQTPAMENLLLASSPLLASLNPVVARLPVQPSIGNFYEFGFTKAISGNLRVDADIFRRNFTNFSDDDTLLDTGVSFPISFAGAYVEGEEVRLDIPSWGRYSGFLSYANQIGVAHGPITGGLFLGSDASAGNLGNASTFFISQDQRNTFSAHGRVQIVSRVWLASDFQYGSGLPSDIGNESVSSLLAQYGPQVLAQVNFARGRVRPNYALDLSGGVRLFQSEQQRLSLVWQVANLTNHLNVIDFASLFSGTALGPPRSGSARLEYSF